MAERSEGRPRSDEEQLFEVIRRVRPLYRALLSAVESRLEGTGISVALRGVLEILAEDGPQAVPQIARAHGVGRQFVQRTVDEAAAAGLVCSEDNPAHRRSPLFDLTDKGRAAFAKIRRQEMAVTRRVAAGLSRADVAAALRVVKHMKEAFAGR